MTLEIVLPETGKNLTTKDAVFSILAEGETKTLTQLQREMKRKYKKSVSFQAVLKAVHALHTAKVIHKERKFYSLNKDWIFETRRYLDHLYTNHFKVTQPVKKVEMSKDITVYTVSNLLELDRLWNDLLTTWAKQEIQNKVNVCKGKHAWWLLPRLQEEDILHDFMIKQEIRTYNLFTSNTSLDRQALKYYQSKGEHAKIKKEKDNSYFSAFGTFLLKFDIPQKTAKELQKIYEDTQKLEDLDLKKAADLFKQEESIEVMVIKDETLSRNLQEEIIKEF